jgi:hypothetical protein
MPILDFAQYLNNVKKRKTIEISEKQDFIEEINSKF